MTARWMGEAMNPERNDTVGYIDAGNWPTWSRSLYGGNGARIKQARRGQMASQQLADETARLGYPITRSPIANFESGRTPSLDIIQLFIWPPLSTYRRCRCCSPNTPTRTSPCCTGASMSTFDAITWFVGDRGTFWPRREVAALIEQLGRIDAAMGGSRKLFGTATRGESCVGLHRITRRNLLMTCRASAPQGKPPRAWEPYPRGRRSRTRSSRSVMPSSVISEGRRMSRSTVVTGQLQNLRHAGKKWRSFSKRVALAEQEGRSQMQPNEISMQNQLRQLDANIKFQEGEVRRAGDPARQLGLTGQPGRGRAMSAHSNVYPQYGGQSYLAGLVDSSTAAGRHRSRHQTPERRRRRRVQRQRTCSKEGSAESTVVSIPKARVFLSTHRAGKSRTELNTPAPENPQPTYSRPSPAQQPDVINTPEDYYGSATQIQVADNTQVLEQDLTDACSLSPIGTIAGQQSVPLQLIDQCWCGILMTSYYRIWPPRTPLILINRF